MKCIGLNGREYHLNLQKYTNKKRLSTSSYHAIARDVIAETFTGYTTYEEVKLPGSTPSYRKSVLYLDFFIPNLKMGVEVHGRQHFEYIPFFHKDRMGYAKAQARDRDKKQWCEINDIELVILNYDESPEYWREKLELAR